MSLFNLNYYKFVLLDVHTLLFSRLCCQRDVGKLLNLIRILIPVFVSSVTQLYLNS